MVSCDDCGLVFDSTHDLQRHIKRWCPENDNRKRQLSLDDYEEPPQKSGIYFSQMITKWTIKKILLVRQQKKTTSKE